MDGWISLHRKIMEHPDYFSEKFTRMGAWIDLLLLANHKTGYMRVRGIKVEILRGQTAVGSEKLAERWKWSRGKVTRFLNELESDGQIIQQKSKVITCLTIVNYNLYQINDTTNETTYNTVNQTTGYTTNSTTNNTANEQQTAQQTDANNNNNNENNTTHTDYFFDDSILTRARKFLAWLQKDVPDVQRMKEPLTPDQAARILAKHPEGDAKRIFLAMHNKGATDCKSAFATYCSFAANDKLLKEKYEVRTKLYTYNQVTELVTAGKANIYDFEKIEAEGQILWRNKIERINTQMQSTQYGK